MSYHKNRNYNKKTKEFTIEDIIKDHQAIKLFLALYFNDFSFEWQFQKKFNITKGQVQKITENLDKLGLINFRMLSELSGEFQEAILQITPNFSKIYNENPKVYVITPFGKEKGKGIVTEILKKSFSNQGLYDTLQEINKWSESFRVIKRKIIEEEKGYFPRLVKFPNGIVIEKETKAMMNIRLECKKFFISKKSNNSLVVGKSQELELLKEIKDDLLKEDKIYAGIYKHLTGVELNALNKEVSIKEVKDLRKEEKKQNDEIRNQRDLDYEMMMFKGQSVSKEYKNNENKRCLDYLDRLVGE